MRNKQEISISKNSLAIGLGWLIVGILLSLIFFTLLLGSGILYAIYIVTK